MGCNQSTPENETTSTPTATSTALTTTDEVEVEVEDEVDEVVDRCGIKSESGAKPAFDLNYYEDLAGKQIWYRFSSASFLADGEEEEESTLWWAVLTVKEVTMPVDLSPDNNGAPSIVVTLQGDESGKYDGSEITRCLGLDDWDWTPRAPGGDPNELTGNSIAIRNSDTEVWEEAYVISCVCPDDSTADLSVCYRYRAENEDNATVDFYNNEFVWRYLLTRDMDTTMDPEWEGENLVGKRIHPGRATRGDNTEGFTVATYTEEESTDDEEKTTKVANVTLEGLDDTIEVGKQNAAGDMQFYGNLWDPAEDAGAKLIGRRIALCEFGQDADGDGEDDQFQPSAWVKRPFVIAFDEEEKEHTVRYEDKTEGTLGLEPHGTTSWRFLLGW